MSNQLTTVTEISIDGNQAEILVSYNPRGGEFERFLLAESTGQTGSVSYLEGELVYIYKNVNTAVSINNNGELVIIADNAEDYSINNNGEVILTL